MVRVKNSVVAHTKHKKVISRTKGYYGARSRAYRISFQAMIKAGQYSYRDRRQKKRQFRKLWIVRINAAARQQGLSYSDLMHKLSKSSIIINRKMLSNVAISDYEAFTTLVDKVKS